MAKILVIYNAGSGSADKLREAKQAFKKQGVDVEYAPLTDKQTKRRAKALAEERGTVIVAAGGDGTVNFVASIVQGTACSMGIIPTGTLNHFAKDLNIPLTAAEAVAVIINGKSKSVDTGSVNDHIFINNSSIGLYPRSLRTRTKHEKQFGKWPAAIIGVGRVLLHPRRYRVTIQVNDKQRTVRTPFVFIGNNQYKLTQPEFLGRTTLSGGKLAVYIIKASRPLAVMRLFMTTLFTRKRRTDDFEVHLTQSCTIYTRHHKKLHVARDGEVDIVATPLKYRIHPKSLRVLVP